MCTVRFLYNPNYAFLFLSSLSDLLLPRVKREINLNYDRI